jgi:KDO2-lipid IV(A) lauroyltransferase
MGCFALPFAKIMRDHFSDRPMLILRAREDRPEETEAMRRISEIGVDMRFLNVADKQAYVDGVRFARAGAVIVTFVDLPASYGGAVSETLFGRPAQLAMGLNSLARVIGADVVPIAVNSSVRGDVVKLGRPFECFATGPAEKMRVAGLIRRHIEQSVLAAPEQWHMWARLDEFYNTVAQNEAA